MKPNTTKAKKSNQRQEGHTITASCSSANLLAIVRDPTYGLVTREQAFEEACRRALHLAKK